MSIPTNKPMPQRDVPDDLVAMASRGGMGVELRTALSRVIPEIRRREADRIAAELTDRIEAMREDGENDLRTVLAHVRDVTGTRAR